MKLSYNEAWTEDQEVELMELLELDSDKETKLFENKKTIVLNDQQAAAYENWTKKSKDNDGGDVAPVVTVQVASGILSKAIEMEKVIDTDKDINDRVRLTVHSGEEVKKGVAILCDMLRKKYGKDGMASFPEVGSPFKDPDDPEGKRNLPCNNPDRYTVQVDGKKGKVNSPRSFYSDFAAATPYGKVIIHTLDAINAAREVYRGLGSYKTVKPFTLEGETINFADMNAYEVSSLLKMWTARLSSLTNAYKQAVRFDRQLIAVGGMAGITMYESRGKSGEYVGTYPITLANKFDPIKENKVFTPTNFLNLDVDKAIKNASDDKGHFEALMATVGKGSTTEPALLAARIKSPAKAAEYIAELAAWFEVDGNAKDYQLFLNSKDNTGKFVHDDAVLSTGKLNEQMDSAATKQSARYAALCEVAAIAEKKTGTNR